jgi:energy-coupling factor transporter ATP-binding protein EcfA2
VATVLTAGPALSLAEGPALSVPSVAEGSTAEGPKVLVLDEPTTGQDWKHVRALLELVQEEVGRGATAIVITHNMRLVAEHCPRMVVLNQGEVHAVGPSRGLFSAPSSLAGCGLAAPPLVRASQLAGINPAILLPCEICQE